MLSTSRHVHLLCTVTLSIAAGLFGAACSDDSGGGGAGAAGSGGAGGGTTTTTAGSGGSGGDPGCGDTLSDPDNCGECGNPCAPGQTCEAGVCTCGADTASFSTDVQPILTMKCATALCHNGSTPKAGLTLSAGNAYAELTQTSAAACSGGRPLVTPGQPTESYIVDKLLGARICSGKRMPPAASLGVDQIKTISDWICAGALDD